MKNKKIKKPPLVVSDIESMNWIKFLCIGWYNGYEYYWFNCLHEYLWFIFSQVKKNSTIYFHFGGGFDFLFLLNQVFMKNNEFKFVDAIPRGSSFLSMRISYKDETITFIDSSAQLPFSLKFLAENFGVEVLKGEIDHSKTKGITNKLLEYMQDDHISLWQVLEKYRNDPLIHLTGMKLTASSQSMSIFLKLYTKFKFNGLRESQIDLARKAYTGGRTEIYKPLRIGKINRYDVNSLYPSVMINKKYPVYFSHTDTHLHFNDLSIVHCKVFVPDMYIPPLGLKLKINKETKFIFPVGTFEGYWTNKELEMAIEYGVKILEVYRVDHYESEDIFTNYIYDMYKKRLESPDGSAGKIIYKNFMNMLYGKFAIDLEREKISLETGENGLTPYMTINGTRLVLEPTTLRSTSFPPISVFVTSYARIENYKNYIKPNEKTIYYTDTDSFDVTNKLESSKDLGKLKLELSDKNACYIGLKAYMIGKIKKIKGFKNSKIQHLEFNDFLNFLNGQGRISVNQGEKMLRFRESLRRNKKILSKVENDVKELHKIYDKRIIIKKGKNKFDTIPIKLHNNVQV